MCKEQNEELYGLNVLREEEWQMMMLEREAGAKSYRASMATTLRGCFYTGALRRMILTGHYMA